MILSFKIDKSTYFAGMIELDFDPLSERYAVIDRKSLSLLWNGLTPATNPAKIIVPFEYTNSNNLAVIIFDETANGYNMVGNDKVQAQLVDARTVTLNP
ncbi:hypothetical protein [Alishewanella sp. SMS8]|uniref:hypothetical protein n=1 Tax=Alishewanella sp. SMS8 TaxID=2994676 RepID=UPI0027405329|nr:hypothetical protein [Alishewanella sp. SMS8]MDP5206627.1 hypothetical protein [Alishewanella sp. SMS9]MDP5459895.1 hypothetical protein [Alishewanella sp. SMS8]